MKMRLAPFVSLLGLVIYPLGCAITDYQPWTGHHTSGEARLWGFEIAAKTGDPRLDGTYTYTVTYDDSNTPAGGFATTTITTYHNNGFVGTNPPAFDPDGIADRTGVDINGRYASYSFFPPWTKDQKWGKYFVAVDTQFGCQFGDNIKQDYSRSTSGLLTMLCINGGSEEVADIQELEDFKGLDDLFARIWAGTLAKNFTMNLTVVTFNGVQYPMNSALSLAMKNTGLRPSTIAVDLTTPAGKEFLNAILNYTTDKAPTSLGLEFSGGMTLNLPQSWKVAFNHAAIRKVLGQ
jgi:hypothetical protein